MSARRRRFAYTLCALGLLGVVAAMVFSAVHARDAQSAEVAPTPVNVVFVGDSITLGGYLPRADRPIGIHDFMPTDANPFAVSDTFGWFELGAFLSNGIAPEYASRLASEMPVFYPTIPWGTFTNVALGRTTAVQWSTWVGTRVKPLRPDIVVLMLGTNDAIHIYHYWNETPAEFLARYASLVNQLLALRNSGGQPTRLLIVTPPSVMPQAGNTFDVTDQQMRQFQADELAVAKGHRVPVVDLFKAWNAQHAKDGRRFRRYYWPNDGIHPSALGHDLIFRLVAPELARLAAQARH